MPDDTIIPNPIAASRDRLQKQITQLGKAADSSEGTKGVMKESAILQAVATQNSAEIVADAAGQLRLIIIDATRALNGRLDTLNTKIDSFTTKADEGTNRLATWTMWLAIVTGLLVVAAFVQAWAMLAGTP
jgi:hypothetical protein